jgi:hypothetical protein
VRSSTSQWGRDPTRSGQIKRAGGASRIDSTGR